MAAEIPSCAEESAAPTVLVVDDDVLVRATVSDMLRDSGFRVLEAAGRQEAVNILEAHRCVAIVFSDVQMPTETEGFALARWVREHRPGVHVLLGSGVAWSSAITSRDAPGVPVLPKPYDYGALARRFWTLLGVDPPARGDD